MNIPNAVIIIPSKPTDYVAGGISGIEYKEVNPSGDWTKYLPREERQNKNLETYSCVSYSFLNSIECQMNRYISEGLLTLETMVFLDEYGYIDEDGKFNASDRFLAKMSNTTTEGNSLEVVADTARHSGLLPEKNWAWTENLDWNGYYKEIPQTLKNKALKFLDYFDIQYEKIVWGLSASVPQLQKHLKQAPIQIASQVCDGWSSGKPVKNCSLPVSHATIFYKVDEYKRIFDSYEPFRKALALDYYVPYTFKILIIPKKTTMSNVKLIKNKEEVAFYVPCDTPQGLIDKAKNFGLEIPVKPDGTVDWEKMRYDFTL